MKKTFILIFLMVLTIGTVSCNNFADAPMGKYASIHEGGLLYEFTPKSDSLYIDCKESGCGLNSYRISLLMRHRTDMNTVSYFFTNGEHMEVTKLDRDRYEVRWREYPTDTIYKIIR